MQLSYLHRLRLEGQAMRATGELFQGPLVLDGEKHAIRCPKCNRAMGNTGSHLCPTCQSGMPERYDDGKGRR